MLGITNPDSGRLELYAVATFLLVLLINVVYELYLLLPAIPTPEQLYGAFIKSVFTAGVIYLANKGIKWRRSEGSA